ncbi:MAG: twin-arginine translocation signal domain-containing protein, partial [bacterium]
MCVPETFDALRTSRREFLKLAAGTALGTAMAGTALLGPQEAEARAISVNKVQDLTHVLNSG